MTRPILVLPTLIFILLVGVSLLTLTVQAAPTNDQRYVATTGSDANDCSSWAAACQTVLRAVSVASTGTVGVSTTINISTGLYAVNNLTINKYIVLQGVDASSTILDAGSKPAIQVGTAKRVSINNVTIQRGNAGTGLGGAVLITQSSQVSIRNSMILNNSAAEGGGIYTANGGALYIVRSGFYSNTATSGRGGAILNDIGSTTTITQSAIVSNTATGNGGGLFNNGAFTAVNTTISANSASSGGGIYNYGGTGGLYNVTVGSNTVSGSGGGIVNNTGATMSLADTILGNSQDCSGTITSLGYNLVKNNTGCNFIPKTGDQVGTSGGIIDPQLGPPALNFGFTLNQALASTSPAIDKGNPAGCKDSGGNVLMVDQRDTGRPQGPSCDVGAYESGLLPILNSISPKSVPAGSADLSLSVFGANFDPGGATTVLWNGAPLTTIYTDTSHLGAVVPAALLATPQIASVSVNKTGPNAGTTASVQFWVLGPHGTINELYLPLIMR